MNQGREQEAERRLVLAPASRVAVSERARLINEAYAGYYVPLKVTEDQVTRMDQTYDVDLGRSVVSLVGGEPVGMALLGRRGVRGWLHSVGTLPTWRRCGIARAMVAQVIAAAGEAGVEELTLEVFAQNTPALGLYESLSFRPSRELLTWQRSADEDPLPIPHQKIVPAQPGTLYDLIASWQTGSRGAGETPRGGSARDERPCWQRELESLKKMGDALRGYWIPADGVEPTRVAGGRELLDRRAASGVDGCCLVSETEQAISIMTAGVRPGSDALACGRTLLQALSARYLGRGLSIMNVPADALICRVLAALRFTVTARQLEMVRYLR
jgi:ribosomal protein S18 acetylase RimI-like enzyme